MLLSPFYSSVSSVIDNTSSEFFYGHLDHVAANPDIGNDAVDAVQAAGDGRQTDETRREEA